MIESARAGLAVVIAALVAILVMGLDEIVTGSNVWWVWAVLIGIVAALVIVYGVAILIFWISE